MPPVRVFPRKLTKILMTPLSLLLALTAVGVFLLWTAAFHTLVCTSSVRVNLNEVRKLGQEHTKKTESVTATRALPQGARPDCCHQHFESGVNKTDSVFKYMFRSNFPMSDGGLISRSAFFKPRPVVVNPLHTDYIIEPKDACKGPEGAPYVLMMIPSLSSHAALRQTIRKTWGSVVDAPWPGTSNMPRVKIVFVFGRSTMEEEEVVLSSESLAHGDVLYVDFVDSYRNLTYKSLASLHWASTRCAEAKFFMKVDEDTFVNVPYLLEFLHYHEPGLKRTLIGYAIKKPVCVRSGKWAVDLNTYPLPLFPNYLYGHSYVITSDVISDIVSVSQNIPFIAVEDAFVTGVMARVVNATRLHNPMFAMSSLSYTCAVVRNSKITIMVSSQSSYEQVWEAVHTGKCNYKTFTKEHKKHSAHHSNFIKG